MCSLERSKIALDDPSVTTNVPESLGAQGALRRVAVVDLGHRCHLSLVLRLERGRSFTWRKDSGGLTGNLQGRQISCEVVSSRTFDHLHYCLEGI